MLRIAVLCSSRAPGLPAVLADPGRGGSWEIACVVSSESAIQERDQLRTAGVPFFARPIRDFVAGRGTSLSDRSARCEYDLQTAALLRELDIDVVVLLGYLYILTPPFLAQFPGRVLNVHDSDLTDLDGSGEPRFVGLRATRDAIAAGVAETRSSIHLVTEKLDAGPVIAVSDAYPVAEFARQAAREGWRDIVRAYAYAQREWMMRDCWGTMVVDALESIAFDEKAALRASHSKTALTRRETIAVA